MHTPNRLETYWDESKIFIKQNWPKFTDVEFKHINGNFDEFLRQLKLLYNNFPMEEAVARQKLQFFFNRMEERQFAKK
jgi:hypothetical protein